MNRKDIITKGLLLLLCIAIIIFIIIHNFIGGAGRPHKDGTLQKELSEEKITVGEAARYFSFLLYTRDEMNEMDTEGQSRYIRALKQSGVIPEAENVQEDEILTCGKYRDYLWQITDLLDIKFTSIRDSLPKRLTSVNEEDTLLTSEFLQIYRAVIQASDDYVKDRFSTSNLYFLSKTQQGDYDLFQAQNQTTYYAEQKYFDFKEHQYIEAMTCDDEIILYISDLDGPIELNNVYLKSGEGKNIEAYVCSIECRFSTSLPLADKLENVIADLILEDDVVTSVVIKPDIIHGKVLLTGEDEIEIEGYGVLPLHEDYRIYKMYDGLEMEKTNSILVGYDVTDFVVSEGKVCAAFIQQKVKAENIRVLLNTSGYQSFYHDKVIFTCDDDFFVDDGNAKTRFTAGDTITVAKGCQLLSTGRIKITSSKDDGKIILKSINRGYGIPKYRGAIEIAVTKKGLTVVNELGIEEYLYSVVPSEMPVSYGPEALKVQAVCARSYAYKQLMANRYRAYGAHVDDSVKSQVYNNVEENEQSILCVKETHGQVLTYEGQVITAYYFSTSSGNTANVDDVWPDSKEPEHLCGSFQTEAKMAVDLSEEQAFRNFINEDAIEVTQGGHMGLQKLETFDSGNLMYRWKVTFDVESISKQVNAFLKKEYTTKTSSILTYVGKITDSDIKAKEFWNYRTIGDLAFASQPIDSIGTIRDIRVVSRAESGIVKELVIVGTEKTILLCYQTNIRSCFAPKNEQVLRLDGSSVSEMSLLPSAFCYFEFVNGKEDQQQLQITGGGFGHGVGMSQNGVKTMVKLGWSYEKILEHYYSNTKITVIYE